MQQKLDLAKEIICELADGLEKKQQNIAQKGQKIENIEYRLRDMEKSGSQLLVKVLGQEREWRETILEEIMAENFPELMRHYSQVLRILRNSKQDF